MLYLVPTPVGNREDITLRALRVLQEVDAIYAEDTRVSGPLLQHYNITTPLQAYHAHNEHKIVDQIIARLQSGATLALISDAGTPGISDAGFLLVRACHSAGINVSCLPGATALIPAIVQSGLPCDKFHFEGFLPHKKGRQTRLKWLAAHPHTVVLYESPYRLARLLEELQTLCGPNRMVSVSREISKLYEETHTGTLEDTHAWCVAMDKVRGEIVVVLAGNSDKPLPLGD